MGRLTELEKYIVQILGDGEATCWEIQLETGDYASVNRVNGCISSLARRGLVQTRKYASMSIVSLTEEGLRACSAIYAGVEYEERKENTLPQAGDIS